MSYVAAAVAFILVFVPVTRAQDQSCPNIERGDNCFFEDVATLTPAAADSNRFYVIGGLFDIHAKGANAYECGSEISDKAILNVLAFFWAVNYYDTTSTIDSNSVVSVGAFAFDNCYRPEQTIENFLGFSKCKLFLRGIQANVAAYVGPYSNDDALMTATLASDLSLTLVSPDANSYRFDDDVHRSLLRMRPSFDNDLRAILGFLNETASRHVVVIYSEEEFYMDAFNNFKMLKDGNLCINLDLQMSSSLTDSQVEDFVAEHLEDQVSLRYIVPLMSGDSVLKLMHAVYANDNINDNPFVFLLTSNIGRNSDITTEGVVVVEPKIAHSNDFTEFNNALQIMRSNGSSNNFGLSALTNPWVDDYLAQAGKAQVPLFLNADHSSDVVQSVKRTITAVKIIVQGMDTAINEVCAQGSSSNYQVCDTLRNPSTSRDPIFNAISATGGLTPNSQPSAADIEYSYYVYRNSDGKFHDVGTYHADTGRTDLSVPDSLRTWFDSQYRGSYCPNPEGCCVMPTDPPMTTRSTNSTMESTSASTPAPSDNDVYVKYPRGQEITGAFADYTGTEQRGEYNTRFDEDQDWVIALAVLAGLGILCVLVFEVYIMYKMIGNQMSNKWRTMWLGQLLLCGIFLGYLTLAAYIFVPTDATCGITRFGVGVSYAICFAVLLVKLMVILTSKSSDVLIPGDGDSPNYLKGIYQFLMFIFAVGVQVVINIQWLITVPPEAIRVTSRTNNRVWICNHYTWEVGKDMLTMADFVRTNFENHLLSLVYIMVLILITTILSLKAHGIITNHRESVFIGIASGFSIPIWLAWGLVGALNEDHDYAHEFGDACIAFGLLITLTLILFAMFLPKVRQLVNMGVEGIYLEDDRDTYYGGSVIMAPPSYKSKGPSSVIYVNNQGIYSEPVVIGNGDPNAVHLKHPGSTYSAPPGYLKKSESTYGGSRVLRVTDDLKGRHPQKKAQSEFNYGASTRSRSYKGGTLPRSRSQSDLGAL